MTPEEFKRRYVARMVERGVDQKFAEETFDAGSDYDFTDDPEDVADDEMSYWCD